MNLEEGETVLCTVEKIQGTTVFVRIENGPEGTIVTSEIAPGRIRNIRDYVVPNKKIVCKVLRLKQGNIELSLRRVTQKETKEVLDKYQQEKSYESILKSVVGEQALNILEKIKEKESLYDFFEEAKTNPKEIEKILGKEKAAKILEIINTQKIKSIKIKKEIKLTTNDFDGLDKIKNILINKEIIVKYIGRGRYSLESEAENPKVADKKIQKFSEEIEKKAKMLGMEFSIVEGK